MPLLAAASLHSRGRAAFTISPGLALPVAGPVVGFLYSCCGDPGNLEEDDPWAGRSCDKHDVEVRWIPQRGHALTPADSIPSLQLVGESFSPWTKKARWALERCELPYAYREYTPTLSEPGLRLRMRQWSGKVSVPVGFVGRQILRGSWAIACHANDVSEDRRLGDMQAIQPWDALSEAALAEGRTRVVRSVLADEAALQEALPGVVPGPMRRPLRFLARDAAKRLDRKYADREVPGSIRRALTAVRSALETSGSDFLLGRFGYADITMAVVIEVIAPIARTEPPLGPATRGCWRDEALAAEFDDLVQWRNRLAGDPATSYSQFEPTRA